MVKGSCSCGSIRFEFSGEPKGTTACHCLACRKSSGTPNSINIIVPTTSFTYTTPTTDLKSWTRQGDSGKDVTNYFCGICGNLIRVDAKAFDGMSIVKYGLVDDKHVLDGLKPQQEIYWKNKFAWETGIEGVERKQET